VTREPTDLPATGQARNQPLGHPANTNAAPSPLDPFEICAVVEQLMAPPARNWADVAGKARFLLELYGASPQGREPEVRKLIDRLLGDMARLGAGRTGRT
jgi:hypothetical protein